MSSCNATFLVERRNGVVLTLTPAQNGAPETEVYAGSLLSQRYCPAGRYLFAANASDLVERDALIVTAR